LRRRPFRDWPETLERSAPSTSRAIAPGRGDALVGRDGRQGALGSHNTADFVERPTGPWPAWPPRGGDLKEAWDAVRAACDPKFKDYAIYEHCLPFNVARAYDEARGIDTPASGPPSATGDVGALQG
jgi:hypothetical protein